MEDTSVITNLCLTLGLGTQDNGKEFAFKQ